MKIYSIVLFSLCVSLFSCKNETKIISSGGKAFSQVELDSFFTALMDSLNMPGLSVAIINNATVVYHTSMGEKSMETHTPVGPDTYFEAASLSKPLFAFFVMKQLEKGVLDLDTPLYTYLPYPDIEYDERYKLITARMVLSHSSGFPNWREDSLKIMFDPGTNYLYSGEGYRYLAQVIAKNNDVSISQLDSLFQAEIARPLGAMKMTYQWKEELLLNKAVGHIDGKPTPDAKDYKDSDFGAAGGLHTEANDYAKFLISLFEKDLLTEALTSEMLKEQIKLPEDDINSILINASAWSLGFGIIPTSLGTCYWHAGNNDDFQSWMHFYPDRKYGIVLFTNSDRIQQAAFFDLFFEYMEDGIVFDMSKLN